MEVDLGFGEGVDFGVGVGCVIGVILEKTDFFLILDVANTVGLVMVGGEDALVFMAILAFDLFTSSLLFVLLIRFEEDSDLLIGEEDGEDEPEQSTNV